jgi:hypothetical protein
MVRARILLAAGAIALGTGVASAQSVKTDFDPSVNFSEFKTYFYAKTDPIPSNELQNQRVLAAIDHWLTAKGWTKAPEGQADLAIVPNVSTQEQKSLDTFYSGGMGGWGYGGWYGGGAGMGTATTTVNTYVNGTMVVDIFNAKTKKLVWRGIATATVSDDPKKNAEKIQKAAEKMFKKKFPPGVEAKTN